MWRSSSPLYHNVMVYLYYYPKYSLSLKLPSHFSSPCLPARVQPQPWPRNVKKCKATLHFFFRGSIHSSAPLSTLDFGSFFPSPFSVAVAWVREREREREEKEEGGGGCFCSNMWPPHHTYTSHTYTHTAENHLGLQASDALTQTSHSQGFSLGETEREM